MGKTDNHDPAKLDLRRHFLRKYHADGEPIQVFDCCQGSGLLWRKLREEFDVASYWGVDLKPQKGRLKIDSQRILCQPGMTENVIDIDTYGSPWKRWAALLPGLNRPVTVFLTIGNVILAAGGRSITGAELVALGIDSKIPPGFGPSLGRIAPVYLLQIANKFANVITEAVEAVSDGNARYIGVRLEMKTAATEVDTPKQPAHAKLKRSKAHV